MNPRLAIERILAERLCRRPAAALPARPIVSFTFDDFPRSANTAGGRILREHGAAGTYYTALGLAGTEGPSGPLFRRDDLPSLLADGHELGDHTFAHLDCRRLSTAAIEEQVEKTRAACTELSLGFEMRHFAYPFGGVSVGAKRMLGARYRTCRGLFAGSNRGTMDLALLRACRLYGGAVERGEIEAALRDNREQSGWLILVTHDVAERPSRYGSTPKELATTVASALASGAEILTVGAAARRLSPETSAPRART